MHRRLTRRRTEERPTLLTDAALALRRSSTADADSI
jgi:hypothetical protein